jgi:tetratricopeptide (TPR) repeat protein
VRIRLLILFLAVVTAISLAQDAPAPGSASAGQSSSNSSSSGSASSGAPSPGSSSSDKPASDKSAAQNAEGEASSSRDTRIDLTPPKDDDKDHPGSKAAVVDLEPSDKPDTTGVQEFHPWSPMKAIKDEEIGDFYFKRKNYKAAIERYKEALYYKDGDAAASFRVAECEEKLGDKAEARKYYEQYLKILPDGPHAREARNSLDKLTKAR